MDRSMIQKLQVLFEVTVEVENPVVVGQDKQIGRRQLIPIIGGKLIGVDINGQHIEGSLLPGGVDSQIIKPDGRCELSARYGIKLLNGESLYIENNGIRTVPKEYVNNVLAGEFVDPEIYYFCTHPHFEVYSENLKWMTNRLFVCKATRLTNEVILKFYLID